MTWQTCGPHWHVWTPTLTGPWPYEGQQCTCGQQTWPPPKRLKAGGAAA